MPLTPSRFTALASNPLMLPPVQRKPAEQLEMTERPWIKIVDVKTHGNNPVIPALSFQNIRPFDGVSQQTTFQLIVSLKNVAHSMAHVDVDFELFFPIWSDTYWNTISTEQKRYCDASPK